MCAFVDVYGCGVEFEKKLENGSKISPHDDVKPSK